MRGVADDTAKKVNKVAAGLEAAGYKDEAAEMKKMQEGMASGEMAGADIEAGAKDAHEVAAKLRAEGKDDLAKEVEELALKMDEAAKAKLDAGAKENDKKVTVAAGEAAKEGAELTDSLKAQGTHGGCCGGSGSGGRHCEGSSQGGGRLV
jgi:hypothetical protein